MLLSTSYCGVEQSGFSFFELAFVFRVRVVDFCAIPLAIFSRGPAISSPSSLAKTIAPSICRVSSGHQPRWLRVYGAARSAEKHRRALHPHRRTRDRRVEPSARLQKVLTNFRPFCTEGPLCQKRAGSMRISGIGAGEAVGNLQGCHFLNRAGRLETVFAESKSWRSCQKSPSILTESSSSLSGSDPAKTDSP